MLRRIQDFEDAHHDLFGGAINVHRDELLEIIHANRPLGGWGMGPPRFVDMIRDRDLEDPMFLRPPDYGNIWGMPPDINIR